VLRTKSKKLKFLIIGFINTVFGYIFSILIYETLNDIFSLFFILLLSHLVTVTFSFVNYRHFVFNSKKSIFYEYFKIHLVYLSAFGINFILVWIFYNFLFWPFWLSRLVSIFILICYNYLAHTRFTFNEKS
jgi:putative flippase GtrA